MRIHLINPMENPYGGSEARSIELTNILKGRARVQIWSEYPSTDEVWSKQIGVRQIKPRRFAFPIGGTFVFVGTYYWVGDWLRLGFPGKIIVIFNVPDKWLLSQFLQRLHGLRVRCPVEVCFAGQWMSELTGLPGRVLPSPIDLARFRPADAKSFSGDARFTVGRLSRDVPSKHHPEDADLYRQLASMGFRVRIMGGTVLESQLAGVAGVELLAAGAEPPEQFLQSLDCFVYRTAPDLFESHGRVVQEAMAVGMPVVCGVDGGYREFVQNGVNGYLFEGNASALGHLLALRNSPELKTRLGQAGRGFVERLFSPSGMNDIVEYLLAKPSGMPIAQLNKLLSHSSPAKA